MSGSAPVIRGFPPVADRQCRALILGTMPGVASLRKQQYYGHPRNAFWPIMETLLGIDPAESYEGRLRALLAHHIALWDVLESCRRPGSADADIREERPNDIAGLLEDCPLIELVCFNGGGAERLFSRRARPAVDRPGMRYLRLPSTSPAFAAPFEVKLAAWSAVFAA
jgi:hypoxanthine-DNA glycosylase